MRQVPALDASPFGIVRNGRVARHCQHFLSLLDHSVCAWSRRLEAPSRLEALASCRTVLLLIPDAAIVPFIETWPALPETRLVHFSGRRRQSSPDRSAFPRRHGTIVSNLQTRDRDPCQAVSAPFVRAYEQRT